jgi:hypothetical protein
MAGGEELYPQPAPPGEASPLQFVDPVMRGQMMSGFLSKHLGGGDFNENNGGIGYRSDDGLMAGYYRNSLNKHSLYAGKEFTTDKYRLGPAEMRLGAVLGGVTGYGKPVMPVVMPEVLGSIGDHTMALGMVPPIKGVTPATLALQLRKRF